jgi:hypothetical protein
MVNKRLEKFENSRISSILLSQFLQSILINIINIILILIQLWKMNNKVEWNKINSLNFYNIISFNSNLLYNFIPIFILQFERKFKWIVDQKELEWDFLN